jgi:hydroxyacylglutathione hydrolase
MNMRYRLFYSIFFNFLFLTLSGQNSQSIARWFSVKEIFPKVWLIDDHKAVNVYLIEGQDSSLLVDTGTGAADFFSQIKMLTDKPLIIVNTHGHSDHAEGNYQFSKVYIHSSDSSAARLCASRESRKEAAKEMLRGAVPTPGDIYKGKEIHSILADVKNGYIFFLGGRQIQVIETPGHTPGSVCLLDKEDKLLFSGDNDNTAVWLFLPESRPLSVYLKTLQTLYGRISEFDTFLPGHGIPKRSDFIMDQIMCIKSILNHTCKSESYDTFAGKAMLCQYGRASVAYNLVFFH